MAEKNSSKRSYPIKKPQDVDRYLADMLADTGSNDNSATKSATKKYDMNIEADVDALLADMMSKMNPKMRPFNFLPNGAPVPPLPSSEPELNSASGDNWADGTTYEDDLCLDVEAVVEKNPTTEFLQSIRDAFIQREFIQVQN
uniref:NET domain-containing protein n=1 Tax=Panagrellus redivivus TaxID=6233 RepID=A0A7E4W3T8_PANRE